MKLNFIAIFYWKNICRIKTFDLGVRKFRLLIVIFWIVTLSSITASSVYFIKYYNEKTKYDRNESIINDFEAKFALNRFLETFKEHCQDFQEKFQENNLNIKELISKGLGIKKFSSNEIFNTFQKVLSHVLYKDFNKEFTSREIEIIDTIQKRHIEKYPINKEYKIPYPDIYNKNNFLHNACVFMMLEQDLLWESICYGYRSRTSSFTQIFRNRFIDLANASLKLNEYTDSLGNQKYSFLETFNFSPEYSISINDIDFDNLSTESAKIISNNLPAHYQIENFLEKQKINSNTAQNGVRYVPSYLVDPFRSLSFFDPENFTPEDLKLNLNSAKKMNHTILETGYMYLKYILLIIGANLLLIFIIRIIYWIQNG